MPLPGQRRFDQAGLFRVSDDLCALGCEGGVEVEVDVLSIDRDGVGRLVHIAVDEGRRTRPDLHIGACGDANPYELRTSPAPPGHLA
jgi:hypothetical protein